MQFDPNYLSAQRAYDNMLPQEMIPVTCPRCDGFGHLPDDEDQSKQMECPACDGTGEVEVPENRGKKRRNEDF